MASTTPELTADFPRGRRVRVRQDQSVGPAGTRIEVLEPAGYPSGGSHTASASESVGAANTRTPVDEADDWLENGLRKVQVAEQVPRRQAIHSRWQALDMWYSGLWSALELPQFGRWNRGVGCSMLVPYAEDVEAAA
jgi:hypothetical protein